MNSPSSGRTQLTYSPVMIEPFSINSSHADCRPERSFFWRSPGRADGSRGGADGVLGSAADGAVASRDADHGADELQTQRRAIRTAKDRFSIEGSVADGTLVIRRECLDHVIVFGEAHLRRILGRRMTQCLRRLVLLSALEQCAYPVGRPHIFAMDVPLGRPPHESGSARFGIRGPDGHGLPDLGFVEFVLIGKDKAMRGPAAELAEVILASGIRV
jgi:hypothetical protein